MKSICYFTGLAVLVCCAAAAQAQVPAPVVEQNAAPANVAPAPAAPVAPTPGGERRAIRREDRRIDRNDATGTLAPTVNPNGTITATPTAPGAAGTAIAPRAAVPATTPAPVVEGNAARAVIAPNTVAPNVIAPNAAPAAVESWRYRNQGGQWLYYTPSNNWVVWNGSSWGAYTPSAPMVAPVAPAVATAPAAPVARAYSYPPNQAYYYNNRPYRRGFFGRRYVY